MYATADPGYVDVSYYEQLTDSELVRRVRSGQDAALGVLLGRHSEALYRFCCHLCSNREDAEDVCQETIARAITRVDTLQSGASFKSWIFSIARNLAMDSFRGKKRVCQLPDEDDSAPVMLYDDDPHERIEISEEHQTVAQALGRLAQSHQSVLMMREVHGMSYAEIASRLDVSQSAVETLLFRARRRLKEEYGKRVAIPGFVAGLRGLLGRVLSPLTGAGTVTVKLGVAGVFLGTVVAVPALVPVTRQLPRQVARAALSPALAALLPTHGGGHSGEVASTFSIPGTTSFVSTGASRSSGTTSHVAAGTAPPSIQIGSLFTGGPSGTTSRSGTAGKLGRKGSAAGSPARPGWNFGSLFGGAPGGGQNQGSGSGSGSSTGNGSVQPGYAGLIAVGGPTNGSSGGANTSGPGGLTGAGGSGGKGSGGGTGGKGSSGGNAPINGGIANPAPGESGPAPTETPTPTPGSSGLVAGVVATPTQVAGSAGGQAGATGGQVVATATNAVGKVEATATSVVGKVEATATSVVGQAGAAATTVASTVSGTGGKAGAAATAVASQVGGAVGGAAGQVGGTVGGTVGGAVGGAGGAVGGVGGSAGGVVPTVGLPPVPTVGLPPLPTPTLPPIKIP